MVVRNPTETAIQCTTLLAATLVVGGAGYFASKTVVYLGKKFLSTQFGQLVAWPFQKIWALACWSGRGIKSAFFWSWSCIRHPIVTIQNALKNIWKIACFIFSWTVVLAYTSIQSFLNNYMPSVKPPLIAAGTSGAIALTVNLIPIKGKEAKIAKALAVFAGTLFGASYLSNRFTTSPMTKLHAGGWGAVNAAIYYIVSNQNSRSSRRNQTLRGY